MNETNIWWSAVATDPVADILGPLARVTAVLALAWTGHLLLRGANPRWRILLWRVAIVGLALVAVLAGRGPLLELAWLPPASERGIAPEPPTSVVGNTSHRSYESYRNNGTDRIYGTGRRNKLPIAIDKNDATVAARSAAAPPFDATANRGAPPEPWSFLEWALLIWSLGAIWGGLRLIAGLINISRIRGKSAAVPAWIERDAAAAIGQAGRVDVRASKFVAIPCSVGIFRKTILLPSGLRDENRRDEVRAAVAHETAHFEGHDLAWNLMMHVASILLWFHPLAWRIRLAHADACDGRCDAEAARRLNDTAGYGRSLARLALNASGRATPVALSMARRSEVGRRIAFLHTERGNRRLSRWRAMIAACAAGCVLLGIGAVALVPSRAEEGTEDAAEIEAGANTGQEDTAPPKEPAPAVRVYECTVTDKETGRPIPGVNIAWAIGPLKVDRRTHTFHKEYVTDEAGCYEVRLPINTKGIVWIEASHPDYLPIRQRGYPFLRPGDDAGAKPDHRNIELKPGVEVTGRFLFPDGSPAKGVTIMIGRDRTGFADGRGLYTKTDEEGRFRLVTRNDWPQRLCWWPDGYQCDSRALKKSQDADGDYIFGDQGTIRLKPGPRLTGQVLANDGKPVAGMVIRAEQGTRIPHRFAITGADGRFEFAPMPPGEYQLTPVKLYPGDRFDARSVRAKATRPIPAIQYTLRAGGNGEPALLQGRELATIRVRVEDGKGRPLSDEDISADLNGGSVNAVDARPVEGKPGLYELRYPKGQHLWHLALRTSWEESAFYQRTPDEAFVPGRGLSLGKITRDIDGITIRLRQSGTINLRVRKEDTGQFAKEYNLDAQHRIGEVMHRGGVSPGGAIVSWNRGNKATRQIKDIAPDTLLTLEVRVDGYQPETRKVKVSEGQTKDLVIDVSPRNKGDGEDKEDEARKTESNRAANVKQTEPLVSAAILDAANGKPIESGIVISGTPYQDSSLEEPTAVWQSIRAFRNGHYQWQTDRGYKEFQLRFEAPGYIPAFSDWLLRSQRPNKITIRMRRDPGVAGRVLQPDGKPAAGATLAVALPGNAVRLKDGKIVVGDQPPESLKDRWDNPIVGKTNDDGHFEISTETGPAKLLVVHESGIAEVDFDDLAKSTEIKLSGWASIDGRVVWIEEPGAGEHVYIGMMREAAGYPVFELYFDRTTDAKGQFHIDKLPPWRVQFGRSFDLPEGGGYIFPHKFVSLEPGGNKIIFGGKGRTVTGKVTGLNNYDGVTVSIAPNAPRPGWQRGWTGHALVKKSNIGPVFFREAIPVNDDGTFRIEHVLPEHYQVFIEREKPEVYEVHSLHVPEGPADKPVDAGKI